MKKVLSIMFVGLLFGGLSSCNNWLDVQPETEVDVEQLFAEQQGFQDALTGVYLNMKSSTAYGQELMWGTIELLAQHWDYSAGTIQEDISRFNYINASVESRFSGIYTQLYKIIMSANMVLENIDGRKDVFEEGMYEIIKGEALAIRAYCHFDLLRLFGPMPGKAGNEPILPYVRTVSIDYHEHHTYQEFTSLLEQDLLLSGQLLESCDPIRNTESAENTVSLSVSAENFLKARQIRFNYYGVKALEARFYLWLGDSENKGKAYKAAQEVIEAVNKDGELMYELGSTEDIGNEDYALSSEHIVAVYDYDLYKRANNAFKGNATYSKRKSSISDLYSTATTDIRYISMWDTYNPSSEKEVYTIKKFHQKEEETEAINQLPLLRLAEMYLIMMECGTLSEANELYEVFCLARNIPVLEIGSLAQLEQILLEEYNKEFYGEGQTFYAYKRLALESIPWALDPGDEEAYVVPLPLKEVNYGK